MKMRKIVAVMAAVLMLLSILPMAVFAADEVYQKITSAGDLTTGKYVMVVSTGYAPGVYDNKWVTAVKPTISNDSITNPSGCVITLTVSGTTVKIQDNAGNYLKPTAGSNTIGTGDYSWTWTFSNGKVIFADSGNTVYLASNKSSANKFRGYKKGTATGNAAGYPYEFTLYKLAEATPDEPECEHVWVDANCTTPKTCSECRATEGEALGHSYGEATETVAPDCTTAGEKQSTCSACGDVKKEPVKALGHNYVGGVCDVCGVEKPAGYTPITSADQLVSGEYVMVVSSGYAPTYYENGWVLTGKPEIADGVVDDATGYLWTLTVDGNTVTITDAKGITIAPKAGNNNGIQSKDYSWNWTCVDGKFIFAGVGTDTTYLACNTDATNGGNKFRAYKTTTVSKDTETYLHQFTLYAKPSCAHEYDNAFDADCNACGAIREVSLPITSRGKSVSEDVSGLAFLFDIDAKSISAVIGETEADYTNATLNGYKLISMGAIASNGTSSVDIPAKWLCELSESSASYAVRVVNIPERGYETPITAVPYFIVEIDGEQVTIEGEAVTGTYNGVTGDAWS